ncbi:MAG TPA: hypothetical protein VEW46_18510 [Pyrinomonadaceae bacterium]|nr:hypothetical protein [Pyrinomonadaceae bacterium]
MGKQRASVRAVGAAQLLSQTLRIDHQLPLKHTEGSAGSFNNGTGVDVENGPPPREVSGAA